MSCDVSGVSGLSCNAFNRCASSLDNALPKKDKASLRRMVCASKGCGSTPGMISGGDIDVLEVCCANDIIGKNKTASMKKKYGFFIFVPPNFMNNEEFEVRPY